MRFFAFIIAIISFVAVIASPAAAQLSGSSSGFSSAPRQGTQKDFWALMRQLGPCLAKSKTEQAVAFIMSEPNSQSEAQAFDNLFTRRHNSCMQNFVSLTAPRPYIRGAVAEGLFKNEFRDFVQVPTLNGSENNDVSVTSMYDFGDCYVKGHYLSARDFILETKLGTQGELQAIRQMVSDFGPCFPEGQEIKIDASEVRMVLAEALYKAARHSSAQNLQVKN